MDPLAPTGQSTQNSNFIRGTTTTADSKESGRLKVDIAKKGKRNKVLRDMVGKHAAEQVGVAGTRPFNGRKPQEIGRSRELKTDLVSPVNNRKYDSATHSSAVRLHS